MDDRKIPSLEELQVRGDAALLDMRRVIEEMRSIVMGNQRFLERERRWPRDEPIELR